MDIFDALTLIGGLCLFLFGMNVMGQALERRAGNSLQTLLGKLTTGKIVGMLTGLVVTAIIQSSSATTVMVVGFVNSGLMTLNQAINVIMGANVGTTVTGWILSLGGIDSGNFFVQMLKPTSFTPILALVGIALYMFCKDSKKKDTGTILLGFAVLMFGMDTMSDSVSGLKNSPAFHQLFLMFENPILGLLAGAALTAIIQSSSASVGILQALSVTGQVTHAAAIPIILGQNIGTCVTALLSSVGTNKSAKRAAMAHLFFNIIGSIVWLIFYSTIKAMFHPAFLNESANMFTIAVINTTYKVSCTVIMLPLSGYLEKLMYMLIPETKTPEAIAELDERLLATPALALERCRALTADMAEQAEAALVTAIGSLEGYTAEADKTVMAAEDKTDHYEDVIGTYLVKLSAQRISPDDSAEAAKLLKIISDFERIADHSANVVQSAQELHDKQLAFSGAAKEELSRLCDAVKEIISLAFTAFLQEDLGLAQRVEPLEQVIDVLKEHLRSHHIQRLQQGECSIEIGFVWTDLLSNLERVSDHCSNIAGCMIDAAERNLNLHESLRTMKSESPAFREMYKRYAAKYIVDEAA